jgi:hypothetical protein
LLLKLAIKLSINCKRAKNKKTLASDLCNFNKAKLLIVYKKKAVVSHRQLGFVFLRKIMLLHESFFPCFLNTGVNSFFVDDPDSFRRDLQGNPAIFFRYEKFLLLDIGVKPPFGFYIGVRNGMTNNGLLPGYLTNS